MIRFEVYDHGGEFQHGADYDVVVEALDKALEQRDSGRITWAKYLKVLKTLVVDHPDFIDGHAHLGHALMQEGKPKLALEACLAGLKAGESGLPQGYAGEIRWGFVDNRPFLRAAHGAALCYMRLGKRQEALRLMEKMLAWNPGDNQGIRYLIGSEYLRAGEVDKAEAALKAHAEDYPPYHYDLGLLRYRRGDHLAAATALRRGFLANGYIAEMLGGNPAPAPLIIWHGPFSELETASDYIESCADLWRKTPGALAFARWLFMHPKVLVERAGVLDCQEALVWESEPSRRRTLLDQEEMLRARVDDVLSKELVRKRASRRGEQVDPWRHQSSLY